MNQPLSSRRWGGWVVLLLVFGVASVNAQIPDSMDPNEPGILEPMLTVLQGKEVRIPNTDQSVDGDEQSAIKGDVVFEDALSTTSSLGHPITHVASPNDDMRLVLARMASAASGGDSAAMQAAATELEQILMGTTQGRIYDGFSMLNFNRWKEPSITAEHFQSGIVPGEYKMKVARDTGETFVSPYDGENRRIWEVDISMLYYDGQIDSDTFLLRFPYGHHDDDTLRVNYRIYSLVQEDFSPTLVMLDKRVALNTVQFPYKGIDSVWIAFQPGQITNVTVDYPPVRQVRGVYTWGWRDHPPRIQFLQPVYDIRNANTGEIELDPQGISYAFRNREDLTLDTIGSAAPEMKMLEVIRGIQGGATPATIDAWLTRENQGPRGTWIEWADLAKVQTQLPPEAWDVLAEEGISRGDFGDYNMVSVFLNNEMYGEGPFINEIMGWQQREVFKVKLINLDDHTHYFRNVDFSTRLHDDILRCCGGGDTSFEIMNFKPSSGAPKVAEMQWRAGWGFRPHYDVVQQSDVFPRTADRVKLTPYTGGEGGTFFGYQYSEEARGGDFRFNPPPFVIGFDAANPSSDLLRDVDGKPGLIIGQHTEGYGVGKMCPEDPYPGFCQTNIAAYNPNGTLNWPPPPLQGVNGNPDQPTELRFPPFLRNPDQIGDDAGDIIPPTGAWRPFLWTNPNNGTLFIDPDDPSKGHWADLTYSHGTPVFAGKSLAATIELPRSSGQVFYQFDDLFHDNSIFSPHPLFEPSVPRDEVRDAKASSRGGTTRIRGRLSQLEIGDYSSWVAVYKGAADANGCTGDVIGTAPVRGSNGRFVLRANTEVAPGTTICVESTVGGFGNVTVE